MVLLGQVTDQVMPKWVRLLPRELLLRVRPTSLSEKNLFELTAGR